LQDLASPLAQAGSYPVSHAHTVDLVAGLELVGQAAHFTVLDAVSPKIL